MDVRNLITWGVYAIFAVGATFLSWHDQMLSFGGGVGAAKAVVWLALAAFLAYSLQASRKENFMRSMRTLTGLWWGRQVGADLYLGVGLGLGVMYLDGGLLVLLVWLLPTLFFANLAVLLYVALHFEALVAGFA